MGLPAALENHAVGNLEEALPQCVTKSTFGDVGELEAGRDGRPNATQFAMRPPTDLFGLCRRYHPSRRVHRFARSHTQLVDRHERRADAEHVGREHFDVSAGHLELGREQNRHRHDPRFERNRGHICLEVSSTQRAATAPAAKLAQLFFVLTNKVEA